MNFMTRAATVAGTAVVLTLAVAACGDDGGSTKASSAPTTVPAAGASTSTVSTGGGSAVTTDYSKLSATLNASGSTFQAPFEEAAIAAFQEKAGKVTINYGAGGSGKGKQDLADGIVDYAGTDSLIKDADKAKYKGGDFLYFPVVAAPITVSYNLKGVDKLQLSADTVAKIFEAQITKWDDAAIAADNPGVKLPSTNITVAHRSDGSGTTSNFTKYLDKAAKPTWTLGSGDTVAWPASTQGGNGNRGVAQIVQSADGGIGYVDFSDAKAAKLKLASIKNAAGKYLAPSLDGVSAALETAVVKPDLSYDPLNAAGETAYPIATPTWIVVYAKQTDAAKGAAIKGFLNFILTDGQNLAADANYAKLSAPIRDQALAQLNKIVVG